MTTDTLQVDKKTCKIIYNISHLLFFLIEIHYVFCEVRTEDEENLTILNISTVFCAVRTGDEENLTILNISTVFCAVRIKDEENLTI
jgi:hypothetical protein